jgi:superfamily II DNA or RNA helicase
MADSTSAVAATAPIPDRAAIRRAEKFTRERFVHAGEDAAVALAAGSARRRALDAALAELAEGAKIPSTRWRRRYSLLLGLERLLSEDEPKLADGTLLNPHQVDALSGTLTALLAEAQRNGGHVEAPAAAPVLAVDDEPEDEEEDEDEEFVEGESFVELPEEEEEDQVESSDWDESLSEVDEDVQLGEAPDDPNAAKRFWFEHATGAGKTVAAMGFVEATRTGGVLILTHRRNLVDQFHGELRDRGYADRITDALLADAPPPAKPVVGPVTVETYQWFVRNAGKVSSEYTIVICDEAHTALGEKTSAAIREWTGPIFIGMTATGALIARHVTDLFPTQTSRFDLAQAARRGVIAPLRSIRIPPGPGVRTIAKVPLRRGEVDVEFDQEMLAELLDQTPFNMAIADLYNTRFKGVPGVIYAAGVRHAYNVAQAFRDLNINAEGVSGETPKRELAEILARYEAGDIDVLVNAQLLAEGWNSPRATVCMHLAPTASKRIYQQRVGRVTRRHPGKEAGVVVDFVHPATKHDDPVVTLHSLLDRDVYRGGAIVVGPVRRGRGRRVRVERRVIPVTADEERRHEVFERELWRIAVEHLDWGEQHMWAALAGARVAPSGWRRARAMLHFDRSGELKRRFLITAVERNRNSQLRIRALQEIAAARDAEAFDRAIDLIGTWSREERREGAKVMFQALAEKRIGRRDQANAWIWRLAEYTREVHEEYAVQRWPETKRLLGLLVNSSGGAHARNARRIVHAARKQDRRLSAALLAASVAHTPEAEEALRGARTRMARKPSSLSRELLRNFPKGRRSRSQRRRRRRPGEVGAGEAVLIDATTLDSPHIDLDTDLDLDGPDVDTDFDADGPDLYDLEDDLVSEGDAGSAASDAGPEPRVVAEALRAEPDEVPDADAPLEDGMREQLDETIAGVLDEIESHRPPPATAAARTQQPRPPRRRKPAAPKATAPAPERGEPNKVAAAADAVARAAAAGEQAAAEGAVARVLAGEQAAAADRDAEDGKPAVTPRPPRQRRPRTTPAAAPAPPADETPEAEAGDEAPAPRPRQPRRRTTPTTAPRARATGSSAGPAAPRRPRAPRPPAATNGDDPASGGGDAA